MNDGTLLAVRVGSISKGGRIRGGFGLGISDTGIRDVAGGEAHPKAIAQATAPETTRPFIYRCDGMSTSE